MQLSLGQLEQLWGEPASGPLALEQGAQEITAISTDSRKLAVGGLFVPLVGERFDGHRFLNQSIAAGSGAVVASPLRLAGPGAGAALVALSQQQGCPLWWVDDTLVAYQQLGALWRSGLQVPVIAVTGSAGKTTTREMIRAALEPLGPVLATSGNENNDIGVPLTLLKADAKHRAVVVEMGMRGLGEIERLSLCAKPSVAVITNIGTAHIGRLGSRGAIATAKCEITAGLAPDGLVVTPAGDPLLDQALAAAWQGRVIRVALEGEGFEGQADWVGRLDPASGTLAIRGTQVPVPLEGQHHGRNLLLALAVAEACGLEPGRWRPLHLDLPGGRSRRLVIGGVQVLDETYNASPEAVLASLDLLAGQPGRRFAVLGTMLELGDLSLELHRQVAQRAADLQLDGLVIVDGGQEGKVMAGAAQGLKQLALATTPAEAAGLVQPWLACGDSLLLKASRGVALEKLLPLLEALLEEDVDRDQA